MRQIVRVLKGEISIFFIYIIIYRHDQNELLFANEALFFFSFSFSFSLLGKLSLSLPSLFSIFLDIKDRSSVFAYIM